MLSISHHLTTISMTLKHLFFCFVAIFSIISINASTAQNSIHSISIIELIANAEKHNGEKVRVIAYFHFEFESSAIYLSTLDYQHSITKNAIWISPKNRNNIAKLSKLSDSYVLVEGTFNSQNKGHLGLNSGSIENVSRIVKWSE